MSHQDFQRTVLKTIDHPDFNAALPPLSDRAWQEILAPTPQAHAENDRLEFVGDALMYAAVARQVYTQIPDGSPGLYTKIRSALHSNATFSHLAEKLDILAVSSPVLKALTARTFGEGTSAPRKQKQEVKATADLFETVVAAYYCESGFEALCEWVGNLYRPLISASRKMYGDLDSRKRKTKHAFLALPKSMTRQRVWKRAAVGATHLWRNKSHPYEVPNSHPGPSTFTFSAKSVAIKHTLPAKPNIPGSSIRRTLQPSPLRRTIRPSPFRRAVQPSPLRRSAHPTPPPARRLVQSTPARPLKPPIYIDLTLDGDSDDEDSIPPAKRPRTALFRRNSKDDSSDEENTQTVEQILFEVDSATSSDGSNMDLSSDGSNMDLSSDGSNMDLSSDGSTMDLASDSD